MRFGPQSLRLESKSGDESPHSKEALRDAIHGMSPISGGP